MKCKGLAAGALAALVLSLALTPGAMAQYRDRSRDSQAVPDDTETQPERARPPRGARPEGRGERRNAPPRTRAQSEDQRQQGAPQRDERRNAPPRTRAQSEDQRRQAAPQRDERRQAQPRDDGRRAAPQRDQRRDAQPRDDRRRAAPDRDRTRQAQPQRRPYDRRAERRWNKDSRNVRRPIYVPHRWDHRDRPYHRHLWNRHYGRVWWCGVGCRIALLFGFTVWAVDTVVSYESEYSFPIWEALEYNRTGETSLWESNWGYVEFTPTRTFRRRFGRVVRDCRDFLRVVVRNDGLERRFSGTACRNPEGAWWVVSSREVY